MRYVILKKINNTWYATRNRYTAKELEIIVDKHYNDVVDFESINNGECQGLEDGVIIIKDDGRELNANGVYLNDDLKPEINKEMMKGLSYIGVLTMSIGWVFTSLTIDMALLLTITWALIVNFVIVPNMNNNKENKQTTADYQKAYKEMQENLPEGHKAQGMM